MSLEILSVCSEWKHSFELQYYHGFLVHVQVHTKHNWVQSIPKDKYIYIAHTVFRSLRQSKHFQNTNANTCVAHG